MAQQGTGRHGHKDSEEPHPHTKENRQQGGQRAPGGKDDEKGNDGRKSSGGRGEQATGGGKSRGGERSEQASGDDPDLKSREYKDTDGTVHHHTRAYMEQHKDEDGGGGRKGS